MIDISTSHGVSCPETVESHAFHGYDNGNQTCCFWILQADHKADLLLKEFNALKKDVEAQLATKQYSQKKITQR